LLGNGSAYGVSFTYMVQEEPRGIAQALTIGRGFVNGDDVCLILGDNFFYGAGFSGMLQDACEMLQEKRGGLIFGCHVKTPGDYGVLEFSADGTVVSVEEKPRNPKSNFAVPGLYLYDASAPDRAENLQPSARGEYEITDLNMSYLKQGRLTAKLFGRGVAWLDTGTPAGLHAASSFVETIQTRQNFYIGCLEEIAYKKGFITRKDLEERGNTLKASDYGKYILSIAAADHV